MCHDKLSILMKRKKTKYKTTKPYQMFSTELLIFNGMSLANYS